MSEIVASAPGVPFFFQLYVNKDRPASERLLDEAAEIGIRAIFVTVDAPVTGKREADERVKADAAALVAVPMSGAQASNDAKGGGLGRTMGGYIDSTLNWDDIAWLRRSTKLPIVLKGIQTAEDALMAAEYGLDGVLVSNHGGRSLDT
jgi:L-lactate dehydrogenase (cytochrome)